MQETNDYKRMLEGRLYNPMSKSILLPHARGLHLTQRLNRVSVWNTHHKARLITKLIPSAKGKNLQIFTPFYCEYGSHIQVGKDVFFNYGCTLLDVAPIILEDGVWLGANVTIATPAHPLIAKERANQQYPDGYHDLEYAKPVIIKKNAWIASNVTIIGGVTIGEGAVIGAGSVVTKDIPANTLAVGVPCKVLRSIDEDDKLDVWQTYYFDQQPLSNRDKSKLTH